MIKKVARILMLIFASAIGLFSLIMVGVEMANLFLGYFLTANHEVQNFFYYFLKLLMYLIFLSGAILEWIYFFKDNENIRIIMEIIAFSIFLCGALSALISLIRGQEEIYLILIDFLFPLVNGVVLVIIHYINFLEKTIKLELEKENESSRKEEI